MIDPAAGRNTLADACFQDLRNLWLADPLAAGRQPRQEDDSAAIPNPAARLYRPHNASKWATLTRRSPS